MSNIINNLKQHDRKRRQEMWVNRILGFIAGMFIMLVLFTMLGCVPAATVCVCPQQDVVIAAGSGFAFIDKGWFDDPNNFWTFEEFEQQILMFQRGQGL